MYKSLFFYTNTYILLGDTMFKNLYMSIIYFFSIILISTILITLFNYFNLLKPSIISTIKLALPIISIFISSFKLGKKSQKLGYLEGLKLGILIIIILLIITLLTKSFITKSLLFYSILLLTSILGSMIGINKKKN